MRSYNQAYYRLNRESVRQRSKAWSEANQERKAETFTAYYAIHSEARRAYNRAYRRTPAGRARELLHTKTRRALKKSTGVPFSADQLDDKMRYWNYRCWMCRAPATELDHVKPLSRGGAHMLSNIRPACRGCNASKGNRWPWHVNATF